MRINKNAIYLLISLTMLLSPMFMIPSVYSAEIQEIDDLNSSQMLSNPIRVAIYDEANITRPFYAEAATLTNNYTGIQSALQAAGYKVTPLTTNQIYNHELSTAKYDVFIMADNLPKANITNYVLEYWLGGGSLLSMDSAVNFICFTGIMPPESIGTDGNPPYWTYQYSSVQNITARHPVSKSYAINDNFTISNAESSATFSWTALQGTSIASELVKIATKSGVPDAATVVAFDPQSRGGKVVHLPSPREIEDDAILIDAIEWLCPKPKGRILFDLSHHPYYGIDPWDSLVTAPGNYEILRDNLVIRSYTIDKLYPSAAGNLTANNLAPYDVLIICLPDLNFTANEVSAVTNWVNNGGGIITIGDNPSLMVENTNINYLYSNFGLSMNLTDGGSNTVTYTFDHPTLEGCSQITALSPGLIDYSGSAYPIWGNNAYEIIVGGQDYGKGRVILMTDIATLRDSSMPINDNLQYGINLINWLTASDAEILIFIYDHSGPSPNDNIYKGPVATALNELGCSFYLTFTEGYLNLSLADSSYKLVIIDNAEYAIIDTVGPSLLNFLKSGGYLILNTYMYRYATYNYLWDYLGFSYAGNYISASPPIVNIWNPSNPIFSNPVSYGATTIESTLNFAHTDYTNVTLHSNATSIAGLTLTPDVSGGAIILGANGHAITNILHLTEYYDDTDDSTYPDGLEIWTNEIAFMWSQIHPEAITPTPGIPGYDMFIVLGSIFLTMGLIAIITIRKKHI
ncbi:MAG: hypothetical protein MUP85_20150 [Candidatus Lokiarchaeota archaeon]|nr:hypothetical protein [Candidatus Lokiarchaeota archaeon]